MSRHRFGNVLKPHDISYIRDGEDDEEEDDIEMNEVPRRPRHFMQRADIEAGQRDDIDNQDNDEYSSSDFFASDLSDDEDLPKPSPISSPHTFPMISPPPSSKIRDFTHDPSHITSTQTLPTNLNVREEFQNFKNREGLPAQETLTSFPPTGETRPRKKRWSQPTVLDKEHIEQFEKLSPFPFIKPILKNEVESLSNLNSSPNISNSNVYNIIEFRDKLQKGDADRDRRFIYSQSNPSKRDGVIENTEALKSVAEDNENETKRRLDIASILVQDAIYYRNPNHLLDSKRLQIYKIYFYPLVRYLLFLVILGDLILAFFEYPNRHQAPPYCTEFIELGLISILSFDLGIRLYIYGHPARRNPWNIVKFIFLILNYIDIIVAISLTATGTNDPARISRLLRIYYMMDYDRLTRDITIQVGYTLFYMIPVGVVLFTYIFLSSILFSIVFSNNATGNPDYYNSTLDSFLNNMILLTTNTFPDIMFPAFYYNHWYAIFFVVYLALGVYLGLYFLTALVYSIFRKAIVTETKNNFRTRRTALLAAFILLDYNKTGFIGINQWSSLYTIIMPKSTKQEAEIAFELIDTDHNGYLNITEFFAMCDIFVTGKSHVKKIAERKLLKEKRKLQRSQRENFKSSTVSSPQESIVSPKIIVSPVTPVVSPSSNIEIPVNNSTPPPSPHSIHTNLNNSALNQLPTNPIESHELLNWNYFHNELQNHGTSDQLEKSNQFEETGKTIKFKEIFHPHLDPEEDHSLKGKIKKSFSILQKYNLKKITKNWMFELIVSAILYTNAADITYVIVHARNLYHPNWTMILDDILLGIQIGEVLLKVTANRKKIRFWTVFNITIVSISLIGKIVIEYALKSQTEKHIDMLRVACAFRYIRLLRLLSTTRSMRHFVQSIIKLILIFLNFLGIVLMLYYFFAVIGIWIYNGKFYRGNPDLIGTMYDLENYYEFAPFNDFSSMMITLFHLTVLNNWVVTFYGAVAVTSGWSILYFCGFYFIVVICILNMIVAFLIEAVNYTSNFYYNKKKDADKKFPRAVHKLLYTLHHHPQNQQPKNTDTSKATNAGIETEIETINESLKNNTNNNVQQFAQVKIERPQDYLIKQLERVKIFKAQQDDSDEENHSIRSSSLRPKASTPSSILKTSGTLVKKNTEALSDTDKKKKEDTTDEFQTDFSTTDEEEDRSLDGRKRKAKSVPTIEANYLESKLFDKELKQITNENVELDQFMEDNIQNVFYPQNSPKE